MINQISRISRIPVTEVFPDEAKVFTPWLAEHIDVIEDACGLRLTVLQTERRAEYFWVDIIASDEDGQTVVIENQTAPSNHTHLGQVLTYLAAFDARIAIWITPQARPEHVKAMHWLNESGLGDFYLHKLETVRIGDSAPAPLLTLIVGPSAQAKAVGQAKETLDNERHELRRRFWEALKDRTRGRLDWLAGRSANAGYISTSAGVPGISWGFRCNLDDALVFLYIDGDSHEMALSRYEQFEAQREQIEALFGGPLIWDRKDASRACEIKVSPRLGGLSTPEEQWPEIHDALLDCFARFVTALRPSLKAMR